jgi:hypothetical protein
MKLKIGKKLEKKMVLQKKSTINTCVAILTKIVKIPC